MARIEYVRCMAAVQTLRREGERYAPTGVELGGNVWQLSRDSPRCWRLQAQTSNSGKNLGGRALGGLEVKSAVRVETKARKREQALVRLVLGLFYATSRWAADDGTGWRAPQRNDVAVSATLRVSEPTNADQRMEPPEPPARALADLAENGIVNSSVVHHGP